MTVTDEYNIGKPTGYIDLGKVFANLVVPADMVDIDKLPTSIPIPDIVSIRSLSILDEARRLNALKAVLSQGTYRFN